MLPFKRVESTFGQHADSLPHYLSPTVVASSAVLNVLPSRAAAFTAGSPAAVMWWQYLGRRYLSDATCLIRPHLFYACFVVSRITIICYIVRQC